ncbi:protein-disulfide reductase DsbD family protein [Paludisphaera borealis]|uniref:Thiol:disulfide interchange protein DsbD n=1 Tax=Paludisphaera borealis TaxID=1387353 RepID=A0A1U7CW35_9BACT|nr:protein-disulfide reductase DsbD domain-containing protein [Paludisphaera borealis]APW63108.1 Thiol:disulfide interchange protein DsbD [Paludisphaera borealis]
MPQLQSPGLLGRRSGTVRAIAIGLVLTSLAVDRVQADPPQPAKKDSSVRARPKDAVLTTSIEPAEAKPGDTVQFRVHVKLNPTWHIYTQAEKQVGDGPRNTIFDLFDAGGLETAGDWSASKKPEEKAEPAFENKVFQFFEDEVVWSIPLQIPATAEAGKKTVRCQAYYQICNPKQCSIAGRWTLPDAVVTIVGGGKAKAEVQAPAGADFDAPNSAAGPAKKDSNPRVRPKGVTFTPTVEPVDVKPGRTVKYKVTVKLDPGLHVYQFAKPGVPGNGPTPTSFDFFDTGTLRPSKEWKSSKDPVAKPEPAFGDNVIVEYFENEVTWSLDLEVPSDAKPGKHTLRSQAGYQICNENSCFPPVYQTLADVEINVVAGDGPAANVTAPPAPAAPSAPQLTATEFKTPAPAAKPAAPISETPAGAEAKTPAVAEAPAIAATSGPVVASAETPALAAKADAPISEIARTAQQGLIPFLIASAIGGLFALAMPCVWPMIPITVNFFVKQGQNGSGKTTGLAIAYCLAIIGIFTSVGVFFSFFFSAAFLQNLANNPWLNLAVAGLFLAFGMSLLGVFELSLPSFVLNASSRGESRGGLIGVFFMALTLTITSFTCTFPVVGGLLVMAAGGNFLYPILGLATFASVVALPFFVLALAPGMLSKLPRSGDWMNSVKVVGGLVEIGAALKFINTAELAYVTPENAWFDAQFVLTAWIILSVVCGIYLLGLFRTDHDYDEVKVGPGRIIFGCMFLGLGLYMAPALFNKPPQGLIWDRLIVGILPPDSSEFSAPDVPLLAAGGESAREVKATSTDPVQAEREEKKLHGVIWGMSLDLAKEEAKTRKQPILIDFTGVNCANCRLMERRVLPRPDVVKLLKEFVTVQLYTDFVPIASLTADQREDLARKNQDRQLDLAAEQTNPFYVIIAPDGKILGSLGGYNEPAVFQDFLTKALGKAHGETNVAQANSR